MSAELSALVVSWERSLRARNLSGKTVRTYGDAARQLLAHLERANVATADAIGRQHLESHMEELLANWRPATASVRFRALQQWFGWLAAEEEIAANPMANMKPPQVPEPVTPVLSEAQARALIRVCKGPDFAARRDTAIVRLFLDTGMRLSEMARLELGDVDLDDNVAVIRKAKGGRHRAVTFGAKTCAGIDRYLRSRAGHAHAEAQRLWLGQTNKPPMTDNGIAQMIRKRGNQAGIDRLHPHVFRHTFASDWRRSGGDDDGLMMLAGWRSRAMLHRYGAAAANDRAREIRQRIVLLGDRI